MHRRAGITLVCLHATSACCIHRCVIRICDDDLVTQALEMLGDPFALGRCFEKNPCWRIIAQDRSQPLTTCGPVAEKVKLAENSRTIDHAAPLVERLATTTQVTLDDLSGLSAGTHGAG